jgi:hypothetical protein
MKRISHGGHGGGGEPHAKGRGLRKDLTQRREVAGDNLIFKTITVSYL